MLKPNPDDADLRERIAKLNAELDEAKRLVQLLVQILRETPDLLAAADRLASRVAVLAAECDEAKARVDAARAENARLRDKLNALSLVWDDGGRQPCSPHDPERESV